MIISFDSLCTVAEVHVWEDANSKSIWSDSIDPLGVSRQGAMDLLRPLLDAGLVEKVGGKMTGRYVLRNS